MTRPKNPVPPPPALRGDGRGGQRWITWWSDDSGKPRTKVFGNVADTTQARALRRYQQWLDNEWKPKAHVRNPDSAPAAFTVFRLARLYLLWARTTYRKRGKPTTHVGNIRLALRALCDAHGEELAAEFDAPKLAALRDAMIVKDDGTPLAAKTVNERLSLIRHAFGWAREKGLVPATVTADLGTVRGVSSRRSKALPPRKVLSVDRATVEATQAAMPPHLADLIELLWLTGMRPGEACELRACEVEAGGRVWLYRPGSWKTDHLPNAKQKVVPLGPRAVEVLSRNLPTDTRAVVFSPARAHRERIAARGRRRGGEAKPGGVAYPLDHYTTDSLRNAVTYACRLAGVAIWHPNQLRHAAATMLEKRYGRDAARVVLGHTTERMTENYLDPDTQRAIDIMREVG